MSDIIGYIFFMGSSFGLSVYLFQQGNWFFFFSGMHTIYFTLLTVFKIKTLLDTKEAKAE